MAWFYFGRPIPPLQEKTADPETDAKPETDADEKEIITPKLPRAEDDHE